MIEPLPDPKTIAELEFAIQRGLEQHLVRSDEDILALVRNAREKIEKNSEKGERPYHGGGH